MMFSKIIIILKTPAMVLSYQWSARSGNISFFIFNDQILMPRLVVLFPAYLLNFHINYEWLIICMSLWTYWRMCLINKYIDATHFDKDQWPIVINQCMNVLEQTFAINMHNHKHTYPTIFELRKVLHPNVNIVFH